MGNSPRDCGPGGQWLGFLFIWWGFVLMGSCPRTGGLEYTFDLGKYLTFVNST